MAHAMRCHDVHAFLKLPAFLLLSTFKHLNTRISHSEDSCSLLPRPLSHTAIQPTDNRQRHVQAYHLRSRSVAIMNPFRRFSTSVAKLLTWSLKGTTVNVTTDVMSATVGINNSHKHKAFRDKYKFATVVFVSTRPLPSPHCC